MNNCRVCANKTKHHEYNYSCEFCCDRFLDKANSIADYKMSATVIKKYNGFGWAAMLRLIDKDTKYGYLLNAV